jgi:pimeloyl-ACP methyl ester carboxylesterase
MSCDELQAVILIHGLARTARSMNRLRRVLSQQGYAVYNFAYPSRHYPVADLTRKYLAPAVDGLLGATKIHFVTHSLGGILVRHYLARERPANLRRVVMLAPPNHGSEIVDRFGRTWWFKLINGPAGSELGTDEKSVPQSLGPADFPLGIIAGDRSLDPCSLFLPRPSDGKVSVASTRLDGMADFRVVPYGHTFLMKRPEVIRQVCAFLAHGRFV